MMPASKRISVNGTQYASFTAACVAYGHAAPKVRHRMKTEGMSLIEALIGKNRRTGAKQHPSYVCWNSMRSRCYSPGTAGYRRYGAKGIAICERWRDDFWAFVADMGERPSKQHTIDRFPSRDGNYQPGNCRWATKLEQNQNRQVSVPIAGFPTTADAARSVGLHKDTLRHRLNVMGMSAEEALAKPAEKRGGKRVRRQRIDAEKAAKGAA